MHECETAASIDPFKAPMWVWTGDEGNDYNITSIRMEIGRELNYDRTHLKEL